MRDVPSRWAGANAARVSAPIAAFSRKHFGTLAARAAARHVVLNDLPKVANFYLHVDLFQVFTLRGAKSLTRRHFDIPVAFATEFSLRVVELGKCLRGIDDPNLLNVDRSYVTFRRYNCFVVALFVKYADLFYIINCM